MNGIYLGNIRSSPPFILTFLSPREFWRVAAWLHELKLSACNHSSFFSKNPSLFIIFPLPRTWQFPRFRSAHKVWPIFPSSPFNLESFAP